MDVAHYVSELTLENDQFGRRPWRAITRSAGKGDTLPPEAAVDVGALISFVTELDAQERDDVLDAVQLAQRAAGGAFDRFTQTQQWYGKFTEVLERLGWVGEQLAFVKHDQTEGEFKIDEHALAILASLASQNALGVLSQALGQLQKLKDDSGAIILFRRSASVGRSGNFQMGTVERAGGTLSMAMGAFFFHSNDKSRKFPFLRWGARGMEFWSSAQRMTLSPGQYDDATRQAVRKKLGDPLDFIAALEL